MKYKEHYIPTGKGKFRLLVVIIISLLSLITLTVYIVVKIKNIKLDRFFYSHIININKNISHTDKLIVAYGNKITLYIPSSIFQQIKIDAKDGDISKDDKLELNKCNINLQKLRKKTYQGETKVITLENTSGNFVMQHPIHLTNNDNNEINYIKFQTLQGNTVTGNISTNETFSIHDDDIYISGHSMKYDKYGITIFGDGVLKKKQDNTKFQIVQGKIIDIIKATNIMEIIDNVQIVDENNNIITSKYAKIHLTNDGKIDDAFFAYNVNALLENIQIKANFLYYNKKNDTAIFYHNTKTINKAMISQGEIYVYNTLSKILNIYSIESIKNHKSTYKLFQQMLQNVQSVINNNQLKHIATEEILQHKGVILQQVKQILENDNNTEKDVSRDSTRVKIIFDKNNKILDN